MTELELICGIAGLATGLMTGAGATAFLFLKKQSNLKEELQTSRQDNVRLQVQRDSLQDQIRLQKEYQEKADGKFKEQFENLSNRIFDEKTAKFKIQSQEALGLLLNPLKEKIGDFQKKVEESFGTHALEQNTLKVQIRQIVDAHEKMTYQAENLANALKGNTKIQGDWGEILLENILEASGLRKGIDYIVQATGLNLKHPETGQPQRPDILVNLPEGGHIVIDSKVSLTHYEQFCSESDEALRSACLEQFIASTRKHVRDLEERRYQDNDKLKTPSVVLMFMPIEGAYALALQQDRDLHAYAWHRKVVIVCPSTLFATLKTIASLWRLENQNRNAQEIAIEGGKLYDKVEGFIRDMQSLGKSLATSDKLYHEAMKKLSSGAGNILGKTENLKKLGARASKSLPAELIENEGILEEDRYPMPEDLPKTGT